MTPRATKTPPRPPGAEKTPVVTFDPAPTSHQYSPQYYTGIPNEAIDVFMSGLSGGAFKVLCYIFRRTFGFHRDAASISLRHLCEGLVTAHGRRLDYGTGLSRNAAIAGIAELEKRGYILVRRGKAVDGQHMSNTYTVLVRTDDGVVGGDGLPEVPTNKPAHKVKQTREFVRTVGEENGGAVEVVQKMHYQANGDGEVGKKVNHRVVQKVNHPNKEKKQSGEIKPPVSPQAKTKPNGNVSAAPCRKCWGSGLYYGSALAPVSHLGTLASVQSKLESAAVVLCDCAAGRGWAELVEDAAKGDGVHKSQLGGAAHWDGGR